MVLPSQAASEAAILASVLSFEHLNSFALPEGSLGCAIVGLAWRTMEMGSSSAFRMSLA